MKENCADCYFWTSFSDSDIENKIGICGLLLEHESRVHAVFLVRKKGEFVFDGISQDDPVLKDYDFRVNLLTPGDHYCDSFQECESE